MTLRLTEDLAHAFLGGLLAVCRADGDVTGPEFEALRAEAQALLSTPFTERLLFLHVTPRSLAEAIHRQTRAVDPFRRTDTSSPDAIGNAFVAAAVRVATADGALTESEARLIRAFANTLGSTCDLGYVEAVLDDGGGASEN